MILEKIREQTKSAHEQLEKNPASLILISETMNRAQYVQLLGRYLGYFGPLEQRIFATPVPHDVQPFLPADFAQRRRAHFLKSDLESCGLAAQEIERLPVCASLPSVENFAQALGCLYVLEGSGLGGQVILAHLKRSLNLDKTNGARFFAGNERATWKKWHVFTEFLQNFGAHCETQNGGQVDEVIAAAINTFACFDSWLRQDAQN